jgi:hypothetical protein
MNSESSRFYRKSLVTSCWCYINGKELEVSVINMSMTGMLIELNFRDSCLIDITDASKPPIIDFYLPHLRLAGTAEVVRVTSNELSILLALKFKDITYNVDNLLYKRKVYRKNMSIAGKILLNNAYHDFQTVNVSVEGLMIRLAETVTIAAGLTTTFEFNDLNLKGEVAVVWTEADSEGKTLLGLKYINMNTDKIKGIPCFYTHNDE